MCVIVVLFGLNTQLSIAADFNAYAAEWMLPNSANAVYDNFYWTKDPGGNNWFIVAGALDWYTTASVTINQNLYISEEKALFQIAQPYAYNSEGTLTVKGDAFLQNGATMNLALSVLNFSPSVIKGNLNVEGTLTVDSGARLSSGYTSNLGSGTYYANYNINKLIVSNAWFDTPGFNNDTNKFVVNAKINSATLKNGGKLRTHNGHQNLTSTFTIGKLTLESGSTLYNSNGLVVGGSAKNNRLNITSLLDLAGGSITDRSSLTQNSGTINVTSGNYAFSNFVQNNGSLNNSATISFNGADISSNGSISNVGTMSFSGTSDIDKSIIGQGILNVTGGNFNAVNIDGARSVNFGQGASARVDRLNTFTITNGANLSIGDLVQYVGATYTQTAGSLFVDSQWFEDSVLNIQGGSLKRDNVGRNTVNLSGGTVEVGSLTNENIFALTGGELKTNISQVFSNLEGSSPSPLGYILLSSQTPEEIKTSLTQWFQKYYAGDVREDLGSFIRFEGGKVIVTDSQITETQRDDLTKAFKETFFIRLPKAFLKLSAPWLWA